MLLRYLVASLLLSVFSAAASAYCPPDLDYSVRGEFRRSDIVAIVRADKVTWLDENRRPTSLKRPLSLGAFPGGLDPYIGAYYSVRLERAFKGNPPSRFRIFSENTTARTPLIVGKPLLLFIARSRLADHYIRVGDLTVDNCGNSARADKVPTRVRELNRLSHRR